MQRLAEPFPMSMQAVIEHVHIPRELRCADNPQDRARADLPGAIRSPKRGGPQPVRRGAVASYPVRNASASAPSESSGAKQVLPRQT
jgi:hypothetical protein